MKNYQGDYDLCVIGGGPAGIIVVLEYAKLNPEHKVLLVEYGYKDQPAKNRLDDTINIVNPLNHHDPYECTNKGLGGSSATWGGRCVMYDEVDFVDRPIVNGGCTWDEDLFKEVNAYVAKTCDYFECGEPVFDLKDKAALKDTTIAENFSSATVTDSVVERWSMPTRFGARYAAELANLKNVVILDAEEARDFEPVSNNGVVSSLLIRNVKDGGTKTISAKKFVLAAGCQETTRLLLRNPQLFNKLNGVPDALGKYYQGHLSGKIASVHFSGDPKKTDYGFIKDNEGIYLRRRFQFKKDFLVKNNLLNTAIWLDNPLYFDPKHRSGPMSFMYLAMITPVLGKKLAPPAIAHSVTKGKVYGVPKHILNVIRDLPKSITSPASVFYKRYCLKRKLPGVFLYSPQNTYALHFHAEQVPEKSNRMEVGADGETLSINYHLTQADIQSVIKVHEELDASLRKANCGKLEYWFKPEEMENAIREMSVDGIHQSGTTRISQTAEEGVVDNDLKVWGTENVYVCSSSIFPTSGQANPTFFLGAFAVRLAKHLTNTYEKN